MALLASNKAWEARSWGSKSFTAVYTSLEERVFFLLYLTNLDPSTAIYSNISLTKELMTFIPFLEIPTSLAILFKTL